MITGTQLSSQFAPLDRQVNMIMVISACYSGSLIPSLQAPRRIMAGSNGTLGWYA